MEELRRGRQVTGTVTVTPSGGFIGDRGSRQVLSMVCMGMHTVGMLLRIHVKRVLQSENGLASFECRIDDEIGQIASANLSVFQPAEDALPDQGTA